MESKIIIYGKEGCEKCEEAKRILPEAVYKDHMEIHDDFVDPIEVITSSNGQLPIVIVETELGRRQAARFCLGHNRFCEGMVVPIQMPLAGPSRQFIETQRYSVAHFRKRMADQTEDRIGCKLSIAI